MRNISIGFIGCIISCQKIYTTESSLFTDSYRTKKKNAVSESIHFNNIDDKTCASVSIDDKKIPCLQRYESNAIS